MRASSIALTFASGRKCISSRQTETTAELIGWSRGRQSSRPGRILTLAWIVGFRLALAHPERVQSLIVQDTVAHDSGLGENWNLRRAFWADRTTYEAALRSNLLSLATTRTRHVGNDPQVERYDPDLWTDEFRFLNQPGQADIQSDLFYDYQSNVAAYPQWQEWMRHTQPRLLVLWGMYELSFDDSEPEAFRRDVSQAQVYRVDGGHFALDTAADEIANLVDSFLTGSR